MPARTKSHFDSSNWRGLSIEALSHLSSFYLRFCLSATESECQCVQSPGSNIISTSDASKLSLFRTNHDILQIPDNIFKDISNEGLVISQVETGSPSFLFSASCLFPYHCCVTTQKIHDIYHNSSHPFTWQLEMPSGWAGGLAFMFVFLSFSISVTLRYH